MIITKLEGGHSNQLFQYAAGRRLAEKLGTQLYLDKYWFGTVADSDTPRFYELGDYKFQQKFIDRRAFALAEDKPPTMKSRIYDLTKGRAKPRIKHFRQRGNGFNREVLDLPDNTFLDGWWQDERYFEDIRPTLLREVELKKPASGVNAEWLEQIKKSNSVALHVRRGDYVSNPLTKKFHGVLKPAYYKAALGQLAKLTSKTDFRLFLFSNDIDWCKKNLKFNHPISFIDANNSGAEDMRLMKHCRHNIMANSSFSWWGAWLNQNPNKVVIAPKVWFQDKQANRETNIVPKDWIKL